MQNYNPNDNIQVKGNVKLDNIQTLQVLEKLEGLADQEMAVKFLKKLNDKTAELGQTIMNRDHSLDHGSWKVKCDQLQLEVDAIVTEIMSMQ